MELKLHRTCWLEIDLDAIKRNFQTIQKMVGENITVMPAVKANGYGHGLIMPCKALQEAGCEVIAVGSIDEGIKLREAGVTTRILVFASNMVAEVADLYVAYNLIPTIMYRWQAEAISKAARSEHQVFVKIETGRGRLGVNAEECADLIKDISDMPNIFVAGVYSHMPYAGWDEVKSEYPRWQYSRFKACMDKVESYGIKVPFVQLMNTPGSIAYPDLRLTGVCPGRGIWGYSPLEKINWHPDLEPAMKAWKSRLLVVKDVIGGKLGPNFAAIKLDKPKRIGVLAGGVSDGISQNQVKGGCVLIRGKRVPLASPMSLEHMTVDLTDCPEAEAGDEVVLMGKQGSEELTKEEIMKTWGVNIPYFWTGIPSHMERIYYEGGKPVAIGRDFDIEMLK